MEIIRYAKVDGLEPFTEWLSSLRDMQAKISIRRRIDRFAIGNPGSTKSLRGGVSEIKIDMGPGYRVYYAHHGQTIVLLLCGGDKGLRMLTLQKLLATGKIGKTEIGGHHEICCIAFTRGGNGSGVQRQPAGGCCLLERSS